MLDQGNHTRVNDRLAEIVSTQQILEFAFFAGCTIFCYDYALTFASEVEYVWKRKCTIPTILFLVIRYLSLFQLPLSVGVFLPSVIRVVSCKLHRFVILLHGVSITIIASIIAIRTLALYNQSRLLLCFIAALLIGQVILFFLGSLVVNGKPNPVEHGCFVVSPDSLYVPSLWWSPLIVDTIMFGLTIIKIHRLRNATGRKKNSLFDIVIWDGTLYYLVILVVYAANMVNWGVELIFNSDFAQMALTLGTRYNQTNPKNTKLAGLNLGLAIPTAMICRLTLNLQSLYSESNKEASGVESTSNVFTTAPSVHTPFSHVNNRATVSRLTGERWGAIQIYEGEEDELT